MAELVLGPLLRHTGPRDATVWVETDAPCTVEVLGTSVTTFCVCERHYALVRVDGLDPGTTTPYAVELDGERVWPVEGSGFPASVIRTPDDGAPLELAFGSCRVTVPHEPPFSLTKDEDDRGREIDALRALGRRMQDTPPHSWPHQLLLLGDQVYADEVSPATLEHIRATRGVDEPPGETIANFEEYCRLYNEAWSDPVVRWVLSTVPSAMIFDDHDVIDDWNTSGAWVDEIRRTSLWDERIRGAFMSYWIYQHVGNLSPQALDEDPVWHEVCRLDDAGDVLSAFAKRAEREPSSARWSFARHLGDVKYVVLDSRASRVLEAGARDMLDEDEWAWADRELRGDCEHLVVASSLPILLAGGMHGLEAWNEAVCDGAGGGLAARLGEKMRQGLDLEHWAAFGSAFLRLWTILEEVARGERGAAPASIVLLSGDVHHAYLSEVAFRRDAGRSPVSTATYQAVCSPVRNPLDAIERRSIRFAASPAAELIGKALRRSAGVPDPPVRWRAFEAGEDHGPWFDNQIATLTLDGREAHLRLERTGTHDGHLEQVLERRLA